MIKKLYTFYAVTIFLLLMLLLFFPIMIVALFSQNKHHNILFKLLKAWAVLWFAAIGIKTKTHNKQVVQTNQSYIFVANHCSYLDIPTLLYSFPITCKFLGKDSYKNIPIFGFIYAACAVMVNNSNRKNKAKSIQTLSNLLHNKTSICIFPEGGFNETNQVLKPFHNGAFSLAIQHNISIVPVLLIDAKHRLHFTDLFSFNSGKNEVIFLEPISPKIFDSNVLAMKQFVFEKMENELKKY